MVLDEKNNGFGFLQLFISSMKQAILEITSSFLMKLLTFECNITSVCSASDFPTNVGFREICRISSDIEPFCVNWSDFGCND